MTKTKLDDAYVTDFFQSIANSFVSGTYAQVLDYYDLPVAHCYADTVRVSSTLSDLVNELGLLSKALESRNIARAKANAVVRSDARDDHIPVRVDYALTNWDGSSVTDYHSQYYCKIANDDIKVTFVSCSMPRAALTAFAA